VSTINFGRQVKINLGMKKNIGLKILRGEGSANKGDADLE
jgi:hypothetical protein